ncbi:MAG: DNA repair exonuclease [archaeon]
MPKFAHISDVHLGGWKQEQMQELNFQSFRKAMEICIQRKVNFIIIAGDLFDSAYPSIEILKETFGEFKRLKEARIPCFIIAGSHDYSVSGKTFLDVLEKAGFCKNVANFEIHDDEIIILNPVIHEMVAIYGYPGKKSGLEVPDLRKVKLNEAPGMYKILMLHTTVDKAKGTLPIDAIEVEALPSVDYYALGHLHIDFQYENLVYPGPLFPNNFQELEDLEHGSFYIIDTEDGSREKIEIKIKDVVSFEIEIKNALTATEKIIAEIEKKDVEDKVVLLRVRGELEKGQNSDIKFVQIEEIVKGKGAYFMLKNTHDLKTRETELDIEIQDTENVEEETIELYSKEHPSDFNKLIPQLINSLAIEKQEGETNDNFSRRLNEEAKKVLGF